jgi:thiamine biosynthesis lipoprotein
MTTSAVMRAAVMAPDTIEPVSAAAPMMGGSVSVHLIDRGDPAVLAAAATRILDRVAAWADRLTRFTTTSELSRLNDAPGSLAPIGPTLTAVLDWARRAEGLTDGLVDASLLDERLRAETGQDAGDPRDGRPVRASRRWSLDRRARGAVVRREPGVRFDLDGVAKGWLADRALALASARSAMIDGDGDIAVRVAPGDHWPIGIADPRAPGHTLAVLDLRSDRDAPVGMGVATSGTSVHQWTHSGRRAHHLIDPRVLRPADTDVVQATVLAATAREAEAWAKVAVIRGSAGAFAALDQPGVRGLLLLTDDGDLRATPGMVRWLA